MGDGGHLKANRALANNLLVCDSIGRFGLIWVTGLVIFESSRPCFGVEFDIGSISSKSPP